MFQYVAWGNAVNMTATGLSHLELPGAEVQPPHLVVPAHGMHTRLFTRAGISIIAFNMNLHG